MKQRLLFGALSVAIGVSLTGCQALKDMQYQSAFNKELQPIASEFLEIDDNKVRIDDDKKVYLRWDAQLFSQPIPQKVLDEANTNMAYWVQAKAQYPFISQNIPTILQYAQLADAIQRKATITPKLQSDFQAWMKNLSDFHKWMKKRFSERCMDGALESFVAANVQGINSLEDYYVCYNFFRVLSGESPTDFDDGLTRLGYQPELGYQLYSDKEKKKREDLAKHMDTLVRASVEKELALLKDGKFEDFKKSYSMHRSTDSRFAQSVIDNKLPEDIVRWMHKHGAFSGYGLPVRVEKGYFLLGANLKKLFQELYPNASSGAIAASAYFGNMDYVKENLSKIAYNESYGRPGREDEFDAKGHDVSIIELALLGGHTDIATLLFDSGAEDPKWHDPWFWRSISTTENALKVVEWMIANSKKTSQFAYDMAIEINNAPFAKALALKYPEVKFTKSFSDYFSQKRRVALYQDKKIVEKAVETAKYLVEKGLSFEDKARGYSALAELSANLWENNKNAWYGNPDLVAVMKYLVEMGADVKMHSTRYREYISKADIALIDGLVRKYALIPSLLQSEKETFGLDDVGMNDLIQRLEERESSDEYKGILAMKQFASAAGGNYFADIDPDLKVKATKDYAWNLFRDVLAKNNKISYEKKLVLDCPPLLPIVLSGDLDAVKFFVEKGAELPCIVKTSTETIDIAKGWRSSEGFSFEIIPSVEIRNYLRAAERKQKN